MRLSGPVRGRGAICRDLGLDLGRIRGLGVRAVVCCLDDEELAFLGAPWAEYEAQADALGLAVIRIPMAEGFPPTSVAQIETLITALVMDYSLHGSNILVHCRGGVGRAGLIAATWLLKMGLVPSHPAHTLTDTQRLIDTIRRRRSPKAIETAEQVRFIVQYINFLHDQEHRAAAAAAAPK